MFLFALSGIGLSTRISAICMRPPGFNTRFNPLNTSLLPGAKLIAPLEMTKSAHQSYTGGSSKIPC
ncbi:uncharacterized protein METZ01_LOCUS500098 [marine metagenome]|uniref:Uncharacterized protein n=1 Tax=marine metagenome TaxID=408172 RepID=A0A383DSF7_9ZZZZ